MICLDIIQYLTPYIGKKGLVCDCFNELFDT